MGNQFCNWFLTFLVRVQEYKKRVAEADEGTGGTGGPNTKAKMARVSTNETMKAAHDSVADAADDLETVTDIERAKLRSLLDLIRAEPGPSGSGGNSGNKPSGSGLWIKKFRLRGYVGVVTIDSPDIRGTRPSTVMQPTWQPTRSQVEDASARAGESGERFDFRSPGEAGQWEAEDGWAAAEWWKWRREADATWMNARGAAPGQKRGATVSEVQAARKRYEQAVREGGELSRKAVSSGFEDGRQKTFAEYENFLESVGCPGVGSASGVDVVAFVQGWWIPGHQKNCRTRVGGTGEAVASASAVKGVINHIAKSYSIMGYPDDRNPGKSESVQSYREGYRVTLRELGVREKRAKVMPEEKVMELVEYLNGEVRKMEGVERCVLAMDRAIVLYLWVSWARGKECGRVEKHQVDFEGGVVRPGWSKTVHEEPSAEISMKSGNEENTFLRAAGLLMHEMEVRGDGCSSEFLFRPLNKRRNGFENAGLTAGAMNRRVQKHLLKAGLYEGETLHSFRRSAVQHAAELENYNVARLMELGRWKSKAAFKLYVEEIAGEFARGTL